MNAGLEKSLVLVEFARKGERQEARELSDSYFDA